VFLVLWPLTRLGVDEFLSRHDEIAPPSAKRMRTPDGKRKYNALLEARKKEARSRTLYLTASLGLVVVLVSVIGIGVQANRAKIQGDLTAANATVKNGVVVGKAAPVTLDVFEDFQCPICQQLESSAGSDISSQISAGKIQVRYHIMSFLDSASNGNRYSSRAANAALCASDVDVSRFQQYHNLLYGKDSKGTKIQPAEDGNGRTDAQFVNYAAQIGIKDSGTVTLLTTFKSCVQGEKHKALVQAITDNASKRDVTGTPTILVNGKKLSNPTKASLDAAILAASAKAPKSTSTPTPSTSASTSGTATKSPSGSGSATP